MKKRFGILTMIVVIILAAATTMAITAGYMRAKYDKVSENLQAQERAFAKMAEINKLIRERYVGDIDETALNNGMASGVIGGLDDAYAKYYSVEDYARYKKEQQGQVVGIGVSVVEDESGYMRVIRVVKGSPAAEEGVKVGDVIVAVSGEDTDEMGFVNACAALAGTEGTNAEFTVQRPKMTRKINFTVRRDVISVPSIEYEIIAGDVGYIKIYTFDATTLDDFNDAIDTLCERGVGAFVFDVRRNSTGDIDVAAKVLDTLLPEGTIMRRAYADSEEPEEVPSDAASVDMPMAVIMDGNTALAAELFACALSDYNKATTVGETTFGKGTIQQIFPLSDRSAIAISVAYFYPPLSSNFEGVGVEPHVRVALSAEQQAKFYDMEKQNDPQIIAAVETLGRSFATDN
ncbi:MAG: PDZ domain-containing protein [Clostridia bacterium]|nr:PDZ domain-containing protein [Clostridia bacterium]